MSLIVTRSESPVAPWEIQDEVELYAREHGRHARLVFVPTLIVGNRVASGTWVARLTLRSNDKRMIAYQEGRARRLPTEDVWFHEHNPREGELIPGVDGQREGPNRPLDIVQMGSSGVRQFLERGNTWSGRGEFKSVEDQLRNVSDTNEERRKKHRAEQREKNRQAQQEKRRFKFKIPFLPVGVDLK